MLRNLWLHLLKPPAALSAFDPQSSQNSSNLNPHWPSSLLPPSSSSSGPPGLSLTAGTIEGTLCSKLVLWKILKSQQWSYWGKRWREETPFPDISSLQFNSPEQQSRSVLICEISVLQARSHDSSSHSCRVMLVLNHIGLIWLHPMISLCGVWWWWLK